MSENLNVARSLAALGHQARLEIFRLLVRAGHSGLSVGQIGDHLNMPASTLAHHLRALVDTGLVAQSRQGREIINTANFAQMDMLVGFLTDQCCTGVAANTKGTAA